MLVPRLSSSSNNFLPPSSGEPVLAYHSPPTTFTSKER
jgi:hypothetical protein